MKQPVRTDYADNNWGQAQYEVELQRYNATDFNKLYGDTVGQSAGPGPTQQRVPTQQTELKGEPQRSSFGGGRGGRTSYRRALRDFEEYGSPESVMQKTSHSNAKNDMGQNIGSLYQQSRNGEIEFKNPGGVKRVTINGTEREHFSNSPVTIGGRKFYPLRSGNDIIYRQMSSAKNKAKVTKQNPVETPTDSELNGNGNGNGETQLPPPPPRVSRADRLAQERETLSLTPMQQWAKANDELARKVGKNSAGYDEIQAYYEAQDTQRTPMDQLAINRGGVETVIDGDGITSTPITGRSIAAPNPAEGIPQKGTAMSSGSAGLVGGSTTEPISRNLLGTALEGIGQTDYKGTFTGGAFAGIEGVKAFDGQTRLLPGEIQTPDFSGTIPVDTLYSSGNNIADDLDAKRTIAFPTSPEVLKGEYMKKIMGRG